MQTSALEEAELTREYEPEPQPEISEPAPTPETEIVRPEAQESETTALVPAIIEPEVIEGVVIEIEPPETPKDHTLPQQRPYWLFIPFTIFLCLLFLAGSSLLPLLTPTATITLIPVERTISTTEAIKVSGRVLLPLTLMQSLKTLATGHRHQDAQRARGTITFYNGQFSELTIAAGTILTGADGGQIITDQPAVIPAANPPIFGQTPVSAHARVAGAQGNIQPFDINTACCLTSVLAKNTEAFTGGAAARDYLVVTKADIASAEGAIKTTLLKSEDAALQAQRTEEEALTPPLCSEKVTSDHRPGEEAKDVTVSVSEICTGIAYNAQTLHKNATRMLTREVRTGYSLIGDTQVHIIHAAITDQRRGIATLAVKIDATTVYQITPPVNQHLLKLIAGKRKQAAISLLLSVPGIAGAAITGNAETIPADPGRIIIVVMYQSA